ncbi:MAG: YlmC/YmxH family sporulation protein [Clostridia bacterium]|nr:YlmC/YmxH family sporulation protein [Clostridia bacterium]
MNIYGGRRLGMVRDLDLDLEEGRIKALVVGGQSLGRVVNFLGREEEMVIPWENVICLGIDVILVDLRQREEA